MQDERDDVPGWARDPLAAVILFAVVLFFFVAFADGDTRSRFSDAGQAAGAIGIAFALMTALRQIREQREAAKVQAELQRQSVAEQQRALVEQRRAFKLDRLAELRAEYARLIQAAYNVGSELYEATFPSPVIRRPDLDRPPPPPFHETVRAELVRVAMQIELLDRSLVRRQIVDRLRACMFPPRGDEDIFTLVTKIRKRCLDWSEFGMRVFGADGPSEHNRLHASETTLKLLEPHDKDNLLVAVLNLSEQDVAILRRDAISFASFALRASLVAEEAMSDATATPRTDAP